MMMMNITLKIFYKQFANLHYFFFINYTVYFSAVLTLIFFVTCFVMSCRNIRFPFAPNDIPNTTMCSFSLDLSFVMVGLKFV